MRVSATEEPESPQEGTDGAWPVLRPGTGPAETPPAGPTRTSAKKSPG